MSESQRSISNGIQISCGSCHEKREADGWGGLSSSHEDDCFSSSRFVAHEHSGCFVVGELLRSHVLTMSPFFPHLVKVIEGEILIVGKNFSGLNCAVGITLHCASVKTKNCSQFVFSEEKESFARNGLRIYFGTKILRRIVMQFWFFMQFSLGKSRRAR